MKPIQALTGAALLVGAAPASAMDVQTFLVKADALQRKGPLALFSSDYSLLKRTAEAAGAELKRERLALVQAGSATPYCPPEKGKLDSSELLAGLRAVPPAQRARTSLKDAMRSLLARKWPCPR